MSPMDRNKVKKRENMAEHATDNINTVGVNEDPGIDGWMGLDLFHHEIGMCFHLIYEFKPEITCRSWLCITRGIGRR